MPDARCQMKSFAHFCFPNTNHVSQKKFTHRKIQVADVELRVVARQEEEYYCLTDIARTGEGNPSDIIKNYLRNRSTVEFLGLWERINNPDFDLAGYEAILSQTGRNNFALSTSQWLEKTAARGIVVKSGRYGGTYAQKDITIHFATWFSSEFYLYLIQQFQRVEQIKSLRWHIAKLTDSIDEARIMLDTIPYQEPDQNRLNAPDV